MKLPSSISDKLPTEKVDNIASTENNHIGEENEEGEIVIDSNQLQSLLDTGEEIAEEYNEKIEENTLNTKDDIDDDEFFTDEDGNPTVASRFDLELAVDAENKKHFEELQRYWVNEPYAFVSIFKSMKENEVKYFVIEPNLTEAEYELIDFLEEKLRVELKYDTEQINPEATDEEMKETINESTLGLLETYGLYDSEDTDFATRVKNVIQTFDYIDYFDAEEVEEDGSDFEVNARPTSAIEAELDSRVTEAQVKKILYYLRRDFVGNQKIDAITKDLSVEDISCDGYNSPVFVYHGDYEQIITNVEHGKDELDNFVTQLAQQAGKGISKRKPQVDATLPNGSRAQLTLGEEVSDHGTNYTIRQFKEVPFTPVDLINWNTFSLEQMAFFWLCIENHKNLIFAGGTASGKTTSLNAVSLFIPSSAKIVSIEDTREVELPQRNWIASVTRPSFTGDDEGNVDEFQLLEAALRQRPDYIVMGEIRGEEGRTLFQVMSTGHTTYTTFHADTVSEVIKRFTTDPINVSKTMFTALDLVSIQTQTIVDGDKVRRNKVLTEINHYDTDSDVINVQEVYEWQAETDEFLKMGESNVIQDIKFERGWDDKQIEDELGKRRLVLAYLLKNEINEYIQVASTFQAYINDPETVLTLIANERLEESLSALQQMDSVLFDITDAAEERASRPTPTEEMKQKCNEILDEYQYILDEYEGKEVSIEAALEPSNDDIDTSSLSDNITVVDNDEELDKTEVIEEMTDTEIEELTDLDDDEAVDVSVNNDSGPEITETTNTEDSDDSESEDSGTDDDTFGFENDDDDDDIVFEPASENQDSDESDDDDTSDTLFGDE